MGTQRLTPSQQQEFEKKTRQNLHAFQLSYLIHGIKDTKSQQQHLEELAYTYKVKFATDGKWQDALKAFSIYNSAAVTFSSNTGDKRNAFAWEVIESCLGSKVGITKETFYQKVADLKRGLDGKREQLKTLIDIPLGNIDVGFQEYKHIIDMSNSLMTQFAKDVIEKSLAAVSAPRPCGFAVVGIGSLGRGEATPFSDIEYLFLIQDRSSRKYFEDLAVMSYFFIVSLRETKLPSMDIEELSDWFIDGRPSGYQIDGLTERSGNIPTGNRSNPNKFICTPEELLNKYMRLLNAPNGDTKSGDLTAMLRFCTLISSHGCGKDLFDQFERRKAEFDFDRLTVERVEANLQMFSQDMEKYAFFPFYDEFSSGFSMDIKRHIYRLPSLLVLDLTITLGGSFQSSFEAIQNWLDERENEANSLPTHLRKVLALACHSRLQCYLSMNQREHVFDIGSGSSNESLLRVGQHAGTTLLYEQQCDRWKMERKEFFNISLGLLTLQSHLGMAQGKQSQEAIKNLMSHPIAQRPTDVLLAHFFTCDWYQTVRLGENFDLPSERNLNIVYAVAHAKLQMHEYKRSLELFSMLSNKVSLGQTGSADSAKFSLEILKGTCRCFIKMSRFEEASEALECVKNVDRVSKRDEALVDLERALLRTKQNDDPAITLNILFEALYKLVLVSAVPDTYRNGSAKPQILSHDKFMQCNLKDRLRFVANPSREVAYCLFLIADLLKDSNTEESEENLYRKTACDLGLKLVLDHETSFDKKAAILCEIGQRQNSPKFLKYGLRALKCVDETDHNISQIECDILLAHGQLHATNQTTQRNDSPEVDHALDKLLEGVPGIDLPSMENLDEWYENISSKLRKIHGDEHVRFAQLNSIRGSLGERKYENPNRLHQFYQNAGDIYATNDFIRDEALVQQKDASVYMREKKFPKAKEIFKSAERKLDKTYGSNKKHNDFVTLYKDLALVHHELRERSEETMYWKKQKEINGILLSQLRRLTAAVVEQAAQKAMVFMVAVASVGYLFSVCSIQ